MVNSSLEIEYRLRFVLFMIYQTFNTDFIYCRRVLLPPQPLQTHIYRASSIHELVKKICEENLDHYHEVKKYLNLEVPEVEQMAFEAQVQPPSLIPLINPPSPFLMKPLTRDMALPFTHWLASFPSQKKSTSYSSNQK